MSGLYAYLTSEAPASRGQARLAQAYRRWLALKANPLALTGLAIVVILLLAAAFAPLIATHDPLAQTSTCACSRPRRRTGSERMPWGGTSSRASCMARASRSSLCCWS